MTSGTVGVFAVGSASVEIPAALPAPAPDTGEVVLLIADAEAARSGWAVRVAHELARRWANEGIRAILADGDLPGAPLHGAVGVENSEGVADLVLYGASPYRVARRVPGEDFLLISAGTAVADPAEVFGHDRWPGLLAAFRESGSALLLYIPTELRGHEALLPEGDRILRLAASADFDALEPGVMTLVPELAEAAGNAELDEGSEREENESRGAGLGSVLAAALAEAELEELRRQREAAEREAANGSDPYGDEGVASPGNGGAPLAGFERDGVGAGVAGAENAAEASHDVALAAGDAPVGEAIVASEAAGPGVLDAPKTGDRAPDRILVAPRAVAKRKAPWVLFLLLVVIGVLLLLGWLGYLPLPSAIDPG